MAVEGSLDLFRLPEILQVISQERKTGILTVQGTEDIVAVSFLQGRIVAADALNATTEEGLGAVLVEEGHVPEDVLRRLAVRSEAEGERLADLLVREGHVEREALLEGMRIQTSRLLTSLLEWRRGEFKFYGGDEVSYEEGFRSIGVDEVLLAAVGASEERPAGARATPAAEPAPGPPAPRPATRLQPPGAPAEERRPRVRPERRDDGGRLAAAALGLVAALLVTATTAVAPVAFWLPFPWLEAERAALHGERDLAQLLEIDQAVKSFFLLEGRFPDDLEELISLGLLKPGDLLDSRGRRLAYEPRERRYVIRSIVPGASPGDADVFHEGIAGDFLLDPDFLAAGRSPSAGEPPLVLLD